MDDELTTGMSFIEAASLTPPFQPGRVALRKAKKYQDRAQRYMEWYAQGKGEIYIRLATQAMKISNSYYRAAIAEAQLDIETLQGELDRINKEEG